MLPEFLHLPEAETRPEALHEHLELSHYVETFRGSAERVRYVTYIIVIFSIVVLVAQWNTTDQSWIAQRYTKLNNLYEITKITQNETAANAEVQKNTNHKFSSLDELKESLDDYRKSRIERVMLIEIPGLGVTFDVNDLGLFSGIAYVLLLLLLLFSLMREHENLHLALFKVRRLHDRSSRISNGESTANYLYHSLVMNQVFSSPPTLAQWQSSTTKKLMLSLVFLIPSIVQFYITDINRRTLPIAESYGDSAYVMLPQYILLLMIIIMGGLAAIYAEACNKRLTSAFHYINPSFEHVESMPWRTWVRLAPKGLHDPLQRRLKAQVIEKLTVSTRQIGGIIPVKHTIPLKKEHISHAEVVQMCQELKGIADDKAREACESHELVAADVTSSTLDGNSWKVEVRFSICCTWKDL